MKTAPRLLSLLVLVLLNDAPAQSSTPRPTKPTPLLSRQELRTCVLIEDGLNQRRDGMRRAQSEHTAQLAEESAEARVLSEILRTLDNTDEVAVNAFNQSNEGRNQRVEKLNKRADALNATTLALQSESADFLRQCGARPYLQADKDAVLKELGRKPESAMPKPASSNASAKDA